jgi:hypothetical protein
MEPGATELISSDAPPFGGVQHPKPHGQSDSDKRLSRLCPLI